MLDIHPPHEKIHGFKDFLVHLFTITIGLLIALGLEGCAERVHHRHLRDEADQNLRQEIRDNERDLAATRAAVTEEKKNLVDVMKFLEARSEHKPSDFHEKALSFSDSTLSDASWKTATATGALSYMEYKRVQQFAMAYQEQELFSRMEMETVDNFLQLQSSVAYGFNPERVSPEMAKTALPDVRRALTHLVAMDQVGKELQRTYESATSER